MIFHKQVKIYKNHVICSKSKSKEDYPVSDLFQGHNYCKDASQVVVDKKPSVKFMFSAPGRIETWFKRESNRIYPKLLIELPCLVFSLYSLAYSLVSFSSS